MGLNIFDYFRKQRRAVMNNEIKEILGNFEKYEARYKLHNETQFIITHREIQPLLDYITNLQQEIENKNNEIDVLKDEVEWWKQQCDDLEMKAGVDYE